MCRPHVDKPLNGPASLSDVIKITVETKSGGSIHLYPNPATEDQLLLQFFDKPAGLYTISLVNRAGQPVLHNGIRHAGGSAIYSLLLSIVRAGSYLLQVKGSGSGVETRAIQLNK